MPVLSNRQTLPLCSPIFGAFSVPPARSPSMLSGRPWKSARRAGIGLGEHAERRGLRQLEHLRHRVQRAVGHARGVELGRPEGAAFLRS